MDTLTLVDRVYETLRQRILQGEFAPGDRLNLTYLAAELKVSNTPLREAIARLERLGIVETVPYCGPKVKALNIEQVEDIFDVRLALEELAVRLAVQRIDEPALRELEATIHTQEQAYEAEDAQAFNAADRAFHETLMRTSDNSVLLEMLPALSDRIQLLMEVYDHQDWPNHWAIKGHYSIFKALQARDEDAAVASLRRQLLIGKKKLLAYMASEKEKS